MRIVLRIGGSVIASPVNPTLIGKYADLLKKLKVKGHEIAVVVGGGALARDFIKTSRKLGLVESDQDEVAISVSRIYAQLLLLKLGDLGGRSIPRTVENAVKCFGKGKIVVMGGLKPGMTTDTVAALIADRINADILIKGTDQEGVYTKDPRKFLEASRLNHLSFDDLSRVLIEDKHKAGIHQIIDPEAIKVLKKRRVKVVVVKGSRPENVLKAASGKRVGTVIE